MVEDVNVFCVYTRKMKKADPKPVHHQRERPREARRAAHGGGRAQRRRRSAMNTSAVHSIMNFCVGCFSLVRVFGNLRNQTAFTKSPICSSFSSGSCDADGSRARDEHVD
jgi:hypothetical protein